MAVIINTRQTGCVSGLSGDEERFAELTIGKQLMASFY